MKFYKKKKRSYKTKFNGYKLKWRKSKSYKKKSYKKKFKTFPGKPQLKSSSYKTSKLSSLAKLQRALPEKSFVKFYTSYYDSYSSSMVATRLIDIRMNGAYDPWVAVSASQPKMINFEFFKKFYEHYCVLATKLSIGISMGANATTNPVMPIGMTILPLPTTNLTTPTTMEQIQSARHAVTKLFTANQFVNKTHWINWYGKVRDVEQIDKAALNRANNDNDTNLDVYWSSFGSNPAKIPLIRFYIYTQNQSEFLPDITVQYKIKMYAQVAGPYATSLDQAFEMSETVKPTRFKDRKLPKDIIIQGLKNQGLPVDPQIIEDDEPPTDTDSIDKEMDDLLKSDDEKQFMQK